MNNLFQVISLFMNCQKGIMNFFKCICCMYNWYCPREFMVKLQVRLVSHTSQVLRASSRPLAQGWISVYSDRCTISFPESFWVCSSSTCIFTISNSSCLDKTLRSHGPYLFPNWKWVIWNQLSWPPIQNPLPTEKFVVYSWNSLFQPSCPHTSRKGFTESDANLARVNWFEH